jgi:hypothetical protein
LINSLHDKHFANAGSATDVKATAAKEAAFAAANQTLRLYGCVFRTSLRKCGLTHCPSSSQTFISTTDPVAFQFQSCFDFRQAIDSARCTHMHHHTCTPDMWSRHAEFSEQQAAYLLYFKLRVLWFKNGDMFVQGALAHTFYHLVETVGDNNK